MALPLKLDTTSGTPAMFPFQKVKQSYRLCHKMVKLTCLGAGLTLAFKIKNFYPLNISNMLN